jgi:hypothetical protein
MAVDVDDRLRNEFLGKKIVRTWLTLGTILNSFEMRTSGCAFTFDLMIFYKRNSTTKCNSFHSNKIFSYVIVVVVVIGVFELVFYMYSF